MLSSVADDLVFLHPAAIAQHDGTTVRQGVPERRQPAVVIDLPWESRFTVGHGLVTLGGRHLLYYRGATPDRSAYHLCIAESTDGVHWTKPALDATSADRWPGNNLAADESGAPVRPGLVFADPRPGVPDDERVKLLRFLSCGRPITPVFAGDGANTAEILVSADGVRFRPWIRPVRLASAVPGDFDTGTIFWSPAEQRFVGYFRRFVDVAADRVSLHPALAHRVEHGHLRLRALFRVSSTDLEDWQDEGEVGIGGHPLPEIYETAMLPHPGAPGTYVGLANRFFAGRQALDDDEIAPCALPRVPVVDGPGFHTYDRDCNDLVLLTGAAGRRDLVLPFGEAFLRPGPDLRNWTSRCNYAVNAVLETAPGEWSFYTSQHHGHASNHLRRFTLRREGFASLHGGAAGGVALTRPVTVAGALPVLHFATSAGGAIRLEARDPETGAALPGLAFDDGEPVFGDRLARAYRWRTAELGPWRGRAVQFAIELREADLYSIRW